MTHAQDHHPTTYFATGALADPDVMRALLGRLPTSQKLEVADCTMGIISGDEVNSHLRTDMFPKDYRTRVLAHQAGESVEGVLYNVTPEQLAAIAMYTAEGVITQAINIGLGDHENVGHAVAHFIRPQLAWEPLPREEWGIFPNGKEGTLEAARATQLRYETMLHRHPGERR